MVVNLPFLGAIHMEEVEILIWMALMVCFIIAIIGHCLGCSDPTAPTQNPFWKRRIKIISEGDISNRGGGEDDDDEENLLKHDLNKKKSIDLDVIDHENLENKRRSSIDPELKSLEANAWAEKRKNQLLNSVEKRKSGSGGGGFGSSSTRFGETNKPLKVMELMELGDIEYKGYEVRI